MSQGSNNKNSNGNRKSFGNQRGFGFRKNNFSSEPREMHKAVCAKCGKNCEVPFKPTEGRSVFCKECHIKEKRF